MKDRAIVDMYFKQCVTHFFGTTKWGASTRAMYAGESVVFLKSNMMFEMLGLFLPKCYVSLVTPNKLQLHPEPRPLNFALTIFADTCKTVKFLNFSSSYFIEATHSKD